MDFTIDTRRQSPNHSPRDGAPITMLVIHSTAGSYDSSLNWLCSPASKVSTHYLIRKDGHIAQLVPDDLAAWHAGISAWGGRSSTTIQHESLGIELENANDGRDVYPVVQIAALTWLARQKIARYHIKLNDVVRHLDIALPTGRKTDPAGFPWDTWKATLAAKLYRAGPYGAIAQTDRRPDAPPSARFLPSEVMLIDDVTAGYAHVSHDDPRRDVGFIPLGCLQEAL